MTKVIIAANVLVTLWTSALWSYFIWAAFQQPRRMKPRGGVLAGSLIVPVSIFFLVEGVPPFVSALLAALMTIGARRMYRYWDPSNWDVRHPEYRGWNLGKQRI